MEDQTPFGSQESPLSSCITSMSGENLRSSPALPSLGKQNGSKPRKAPTITPRTFTRFFTPKSSLERGGRIGASRQALRDITASASNRKRRRTPTKDTIQILGEHDEGTVGTLRRRKRRIPDSLDVTPDRSSPLKRIRNQSLDIVEDGDSDSETSESREDPEDPLQRYSRQRKSISPIIKSKFRGAHGVHLRREIGILDRTSESWCLGRGAWNSKDWQRETTDFMSRPEDEHVCMNVVTPSDLTIPFCTASCNSRFRVLPYIFCKMH